MPPRWGIVVSAFDDYKEAAPPVLTQHSFDESSETGKRGTWRMNEFPKVPL
jgi:hypothetical protein